MNILRKDFGKFTIGVWVALIGLFMTLLAWGMQAYSLMDWEGAVALGLQEVSFAGDEVEKALANIEKGVAIADMIWALPLTLLALIGIVGKKLFGMVAAMMDFAICVYFPLFFAFQKWEAHQETAIAALILFALPSLLGIIGLWANREIYKN